MIGKHFVKRYCVFARRDKKDKWSDWAQTDSKIRAFEFAENIKFYGYLAKLIDKKTGEIAEFD